MKLIFEYRVLTHTLFTGVENYAHNIYKNIKKMCDVYVATPKIEIKNKFFAHLWTHLVLPLKKGDILFCPANITPLFVPKDKRVVVTIHDLAFLIYPQSFSLSFRVYYKLVVPYIIKRADRIITVSNYSKNEIEKHYPHSKGKISVVYNGYNREFCKIASVEKKRQILFVGSMNERKNLSGMLRAFELLSDNTYRLIIVGNFSSNFNIDIEHKMLLNKAKMNPNIEFKSDVDNSELVRLYNESELFVFLSFYEGFGLPILEAMACGTAVVSSDSSSMPEVGGDAAIYCNSSNTHEIKEAIETLIYNKELREKMQNLGLERVKLFSWEKSAKEHLAVFEKVLA